LAAGLQYPSGECLPGDRQSRAHSSNMCGISGVYNLKGRAVRPEEIAAQIETMVHRGPNQGEIFVPPRGRCGLGIRRLSIIDVAGGSQPLSNEDESIHLVYNGETYNHRELRRELEDLGHRPKSGSDGEVVVHGYEAWGPEATLDRLRGMAAFALWDEDRQQLFLARDRFGIKPLYYAEHQDRLYFASEIKAILADPSFPRRVNLPALEALFTVGFVPGPDTLFQGVYKLPPAHFLMAGHGTYRIWRYWHLDYEPAPNISIVQATEMFGALLREAVQLRMMSEVPLGALLSGGLDSGMLVALLQARLDRPLTTVSIGFDQPAYDEAALARELTAFIGTDHQPTIFTAAHFAAYPQVMRHLEEPQCAATAVPIFHLYRACREAGLTVVLTGEGADELLGGYHWHRGDALVRPLLPWPGSLRRMIAGAPLPMSAAARRVLGRGARDVPLRFQHWLEVGNDQDRQRLFSGEVHHFLGQNRANPLLATWAEPPPGPNAGPVLHQMQWLESRTRLADFINFEVDKMSMAHSVEARVPYLDHKLWEFCAGLPARFKLRGRIDKYLLRRAARGNLPKATLTRRKKGLAAPYADWLRAERLPDWAEACLAPEAIRQAGLFELDAVGAIRGAHQQGQPNLGPLLMGVLSTQVWYQQFMR
jgi:asparagine synthase (glutamine-hydrolysing)